MLKRCINAFSYRFWQAISTTRVIAVLALMMAFTFAVVHPISYFCKDVGSNAHPFVFAHFTNDYICQLVIASAVVVLFSDAPFESDAQAYIITRAGRVSWSVGMCLYILIMSFIYVSMLCVVSTLALLPNLEFEYGWGKVLGTLARTNAGTHYELTLYLSDYIIGAYTPLKAMCISFFLEWGCCVWIGLIIYLFNSLCRVPLGCFVAAGFAFLDITVANEWTPRFYKISPLTMVQLDSISSSRSLIGLTVEYATTFFLLSIFIFAGICVLIPVLKRWAMLKPYGGTPMNIVSLHNVTKCFGQQTVLENVNIDCVRGNIYGLVGRNGSGKTVLLKCICGLVTPDSGIVFVNGKQIGADVDFPDEVGFIIETPGFLLHESGISNLRRLAAIKKCIDDERICQCMQLVGLDSASKKAVGKYSLGMRQRLGIAQAIMERPKVLVLDEPMNGLDDCGVNQMRILLKNLAQEGTTIIIASHSKDDIELLCDEVYRIDGGFLQKITQAKE